jgi:putative OPT family oligopeptide transporter
MSNDNNQTLSDQPFVPASQSLPEITFRVIVLGIFLTIILAAANAFLGLKIGQTVSASIPAAIISMGILRFFRNSNILENTMVQTMASVGEALISGVSFVIPALVILHVWNGFYYWQTACIALLGGIFGVLFTIPLRRALLIDKTLRYPEGLAISNVLKASVNTEKTDLKFLVWGGTVGGIISLFQTGFEILTDTFNFWIKTSGTLFGFSLGLSPALLAAGYICGINIAISFLVGITVGWLAGVPVLTWIYGVPNINDATDAAMSIWSEHIRYIGVGTMLVGGLWTLFTLIKPIIRSMSTSFATLRQVKSAGTNVALRTERDIPINYVLGGLILLLVPVFILLASYIVPGSPAITTQFRGVICGFTALYVLLGGFLFCSVSAYFAGLIGSSNMPVSGVLVSSLLIFCLLLLAMFNLNGGIAGKEMLAVILAVGSSAIICAGIAISNDTMQDLKVGQLIGATPWKQQVMLILGVVVTALVMPPILDLLYNAYGIAGVFPHPGMNKAQMLMAPQAMLVAAVSQGVLGSNMAWSMIAIGAIIAVLCILVDNIAKQYGTRLPVLAVGSGIYLSMAVTVPVIIGGLLAYFIEKRLDAQHGNGRRAENEKIISAHRHRGLLLSCGVVAGASIMGVVLAIPFAIEQSSDALKLMPDQYIHFAGILSVIVTVLLLSWIYHMVMKKANP